MSSEPEEAIEEISQKIESLRELKSLTFHQDFVYKSIIKPELDKLASAGKQSVVDAFSHYYRTNRNIIAYLWTELENLRHPELKDEEVIS